MSQPPATNASTHQIPDGEVEIGRIVGVFGIRGEAKLEPYAESPARYNTLKDVTACLPNGGRRALTVAGARLHKTHILLRFEGVTTANDAEALRGATLVIPLSERPPLPKGQYYVSDLVGLMVVTTAGEEIGPITEVLQTPANDVYVTDRGLIPAVKEYIRDVDLEKRRVVVAVVEGLFEEPKQ